MSNPPFKFQALPHWVLYPRRSQIKEITEVAPPPIPTKCWRDRGAYCLRSRGQQHWYAYIDGKWFEYDDGDYFQDHGSPPTPKEHRALKQTPWEYLNDRGCWWKGEPIGNPSYLDDLKWQLYLKDLRQDRLPRGKRQMR